MDPGNWLTSLAGGGQYGYTLLSVLFVSIIVAMIMQSLSIRLGVVTRTDLAQAIAQRAPKSVRISLWLLNELAMMATDLTGVVGTSIALYLLFRLPLIVGVFITCLLYTSISLTLMNGCRLISYRNLRKSCITSLVTN